MAHGHIQRDPGMTHTTGIGVIVFTLIVKLKNFRCFPISHCATIRRD